ncbi:MAG: hypothetical protein FWC50_06175 [Planctomycetaceae bacterium]|nr:hypothetical protein [Planctomycetaceae bacterium]
MNKNEQTYVDFLKKQVYHQISSYFSKKPIGKIVLEYLENPLKVKFQEYYFDIFNNKNYYFETNHFFKEFKSQYSLQGIDKKFLDKLEKDKGNILCDIRNDKLAELYFRYFKDAEIQHGDDIKKRELGSFFTKLVHTFQPNKYCALDYKIKKYFELKNESYFISFCVISAAYRDWATDHREIIQKIRNRFTQANKKENVKHEKLTDLKLLDIIFWSKANR